MFRFFSLARNRNKKPEMIHLQTQLFWMNIKIQRRQRERRTGLPKVSWKHSRQLSYIVCVCRTRLQSEFLLILISFIAKALRLLRIPFNSQVLIFKLNYCLIWFLILQTVFSSKNLAQTFRKNAQSFSKLTDFKVCVGRLSLSCKQIAFLLLGYSN